MIFNAENLVIMIPSKRCNLNCPYCISKILEPIEYNDFLYARNIDKVKTIAEKSNISSVIITSAEEPTLCHSVLDMIMMFNTFPVELQTNGVIFEGEYNVRLLDDFINVGLDTISISTDYIYKNPIDRIKNMSYFLLNAKDRGINVRLSVNITDQADIYIHELINKCKENNICQLTFRNITLPFYNKENEVTKWIKDNTQLRLHEDLYKTLVDEIIPYSDLIRVTKSGTHIWDYEGISIAVFDDYIQSNYDVNEIRTLIYQVDGHLYTSWTSKVSKIF